MHIVNPDSCLFYILAFSLTYVNGEQAHCIQSNQQPQQKMTQFSVK